MLAYFGGCRTAKNGFGEGSKSRSAQNRHGEEAVVSRGDAEGQMFQILPHRGNAIRQFAGGKLADKLTMRSMVEGEPVGVRC
jgi:hypothetical protein